jgi:glycosyltransferase involved in cell wall biosynthesis
MDKLKENRIIVDVSNIKVGGGVQVSLSFINYLESNFEHGLSVYYILSTPVFEQVSRCLDSARYTVVDTGVYTLNPLSKSRLNIRKYIDYVNPSVVFTVFGPSFWRVRRGACNHVVGFANAWLVNPNTIAYEKFNIPSRFFVRLKNFILGKLLYSKERYYITETHDVKNKFVELFSLEEKCVEVIPNALPYMYSSDSTKLIGSTLPEIHNNSFKFITIAANYPHKNLDVIAGVGKILDSKGYDFIFYVTMRDEEYELTSCDFQRYTYNLGIIPVEDCPQYYYAADAMFLPTLLECFSVSYLEAMYCGTPIATSDFDFSREVCGEAAVYFDPLSVEDITMTLSKIMTSKSLRKNLSNDGKVRIKEHLTNEARSIKYIDFLVNIGNKNVSK